jgi:hypothetical protein
VGEVRIGKEESLSEFQVSGVIRYAKNLQIACRFPITPFDV